MSAKLLKQLQLYSFLFIIWLFIYLQQHIVVQRHEYVFMLRPWGIKSQCALNDSLNDLIGVLIFPISKEMLCKIQETI